MSLADAGPVLSVVGVVVAALVAAWAVRGKNRADASKSTADAQSVIIADLRAQYEHVSARQLRAEERLAGTESRLAEVEAADRKKQTLIDRLIRWTRRSWEVLSDEQRAELGDPPTEDHAVTVVTTTTVKE